MQRAADAIRNAQLYGAETFIAPTDIVSGNKKLNMTFVAQLFNTDHGLNLKEEEKVDLSSILPTADDEGG
jgi:plastin-1